MRIYFQRPEVKERQRLLRQRPEFKEKARKLSRDFNDREVVIKQVFAELGIHFESAADARRAYRELME